MSVSDATVLHLSLGDDLYELDAAQLDPGTTKILKTEHGQRASLDPDDLARQHHSDTFSGES